MKLVPMESSDWEWMQEYLKDAELFRESAIEPPDLYKPIYVHILRLDDDTPVGWFQLFNIDAMNRKAEFGVRILRDEGSIGLFRMGYRYAREVAFGEHDLHRVTARILATNERAIRCAEGFGFVKEGVEREAHISPDGEPIDIVVFGLLRSDLTQKRRRDK